MGWAATRMIPWVSSCRARDRKSMQPPQTKSVRSLHAVAQHRRVRCVRVTLTHCSHPCCVSRASRLYTTCMIGMMSMRLSNTYDCSLTDEAAGSALGQHSAQYRDTPVSYLYIIASRQKWRQ